MMMMGLAYIIFFSINFVTAISCGLDQYTVDIKNATRQCIDCPVCGPGMGSDPPCGDFFTEPLPQPICKICKIGHYWSNTHNAEACMPCSQCLLHEIVEKKCTPVSNAKCSNKCEPGYYRNALNSCELCPSCCKDSSDDEGCKDKLECKDSFLCSTPIPVQQNDTQNSTTLARNDSTNIKLHTFTSLSPDSGPETNNSSHLVLHVIIGILVVLVLVIIVVMACHYTGTWKRIQGRFTPARGDPVQVEGEDRAPGSTRGGSLHMSETDTNTSLTALNRRSTSGINDAAVGPSDVNESLLYDAAAGPSDVNEPLLDDAAAGSSEVPSSSSKLPERVDELNAGMHGKLCRELNIENEGRDWRTLAGRMGDSISTVHQLKGEKNPAGALLLKWGTVTGNNVAKLVRLLKDMQRDDLVCLLLARNEVSMKCL